MDNFARPSTALRECSMEGLPPERMVVALAEQPDPERKAQIRHQFISRSSATSLSLCELKP
jgi:hypothetical protein